MVKMVIIAGNYREYVTYIYNNNLTKEKCPYVYHGDQLKVFPSETPILLVGSYINNPATHWQQLFTKFGEVIQVNEYEPTNDAAATE